MITLTTAEAQIAHEALVKWASQREEYIRRVYRNQPATQQIRMQPVRRMKELAVRLSLEMSQADRHQSLIEGEKQC